MMKITNATFGQIAANCKANRIVILRKIRKDGTPGACMKYERIGAEKSAQDVINRLEKFNPGSRWIEG